MTPAPPHSPFLHPQPHLSTSEDIPNEILVEILSYLPTLTRLGKLPAITSTSLERTPVLRALSQTSRTLRLRCLPMAWSSLELCRARFPTVKGISHLTIYELIYNATNNAVRILNACPHLYPFIETVSIVMTYIRSLMIVPTFAACLAKLPNLTTIQVIHTELSSTEAVERGFQGQLLPSVRKITLPDSMHPILRSLPNVEEVVCIDGSEYGIVSSLVKGDCRCAHTLKGVIAPLSELVTLLPGLRYIAVPRGPEDWDLKPLVDFSLLEAIEITVYYVDERDPPDELIHERIREASDILQANTSHTKNKEMIVTRWEGIIGKSSSGVEDMTCEVIGV